MASLVLTGDTSGQVTLAAPAVAGTTTLTLQATTGTVALQSDGIGFSQTYSNVTSSRVSGTTYTNSTGKPIFVVIVNDVSATNLITIAGSAITTSSSNAAGSRPVISFIVPTGSTYAFTSSGTIVSWYELR